MPTFKNIRIKMKNGKTRLQRVQILASGKYKFVKNIKSASSKTSRARKPSKSLKRRSGKSRNVRKTGKGKMFRNIGAVGAAEDVAWGFIGFTLLGQTPSALPMTRTIQGITGYVLNRRGKARAIYGVLDLISLWLAGGMGTTTRVMGGPGGIVSQFKAALQLRPL